MSVCNVDCFRCPFDDCINDELTYQDIKQSKEIDKAVVVVSDQLERKRKASREYYCRNREKRREYMRNYRESNREKINANRRKWYKEHRDERALYMKELNARARFELIRDKYKY